MDKHSNIWHDLEAKESFQRSIHPNPTHLCSFWAIYFKPVYNIEAFKPVTGSVAVCGSVGHYLAATWWPLVVFAHFCVLKRSHKGWLGELSNLMQEGREGEVGNV